MGVPSMRGNRRDEIRLARQLYENSRSKIRAIFAEARLGHAIDEVTRRLVDDIATSVHRNPWALISVARLKSADEYTYMHSVAVCAMMVALARRLELSDDQIRESGVAGLLHDIGKAQIPGEILSKQGRLTDKEFEIVKTHPRKGWEILQGAKGIGDAAREACLHHHEKVDGSGYPDRLLGDNISLWARMVAVCDVYDAVTTNRPYKKAWDPAEALRIMARWTKSHLDESVFGAFVKSVGIYPIGSFVRLESGLMGVVIEQAGCSLLTPKIRIFFSAKTRTYLQPRVVDLSLATTQDRIVSPESPGSWGIADSEKYWQ
jgi:putative nucleotidyltransferase with HDIG domain